MDDLAVLDAVREAVLAANHYRAEDVPELRMRMHLINTVTELGASAAVHYDAWERAVSAYVGPWAGGPANPRTRCTRGPWAVRYSRFAGQHTSAGQREPTRT
ncbi:hypothetical protein [Amycolatopsis sp. NPDC051371]|uniref:acyl-CoA-like ligand-binding transcription factor n=1 Tax=Amycolatopsis sp. NPDC051371 TaxID=3155800 RepID=UPI00341A897E